MTTIAQPQNDLSQPVHPADLTAFVNGYIEALLFTSNDESDDSGGSPLNENHSGDDFTAEARAHLEATCARFVEHTHDLLIEATACSGYSWNQAGMDLWLTAGGHGVGFWDRDALPSDLQQALTERCQYKEMYVTLGDDGKLHHHGTDHDYRSEAQRIQAEMKVLRATLDEAAGNAPAPSLARSRL